MNSSSLNFRESLNCLIVMALGKFAIFPFSSFVIKETLLSEVETNVQDLEKDVLRVQNLIQDANNTLENLSEEYGKHLLWCENNVDNDYA